MSHRTSTLARACILSSLFPSNATLHGYLLAAEGAGGGEGGGQEGLGEAEAGEQAGGGAHGLKDKGEEEERLYEGDVGVGVGL